MRKWLLFVNLTLPVLRPYCNDQHYWQVYFDANRLGIPRPGHYSPTVLARITVYQSIGPLSRDMYSNTWHPLSASQSCGGYLTITLTVIWGLRPAKPDENRSEASNTPGWLGAARLRLVSGEAETV
jgi:hypothetical protein